MSSITNNHADVKTETEQEALLRRWSNAGATLRATENSLSEIVQLGGNDQCIEIAREQVLLAATVLADLNCEMILHASRSGSAEAIADGIYASIGRGLVSASTTPLGVVTKRCQMVRTVDGSPALTEGPY
jgi:hypothetical protein